MRKLKHVENELIESSLEAYAMSNFRPKNTGLSMVIWLAPKTGNEQHGPRIKAQKKHGDTMEWGNWVTITIEDEPQVIGSGLSNADIQELKRFIYKNMTALIEFWNNEIDSADFSKAIQKV